MIKDVITGLGSFQVAVQLMNGTAPLPHNYSLSPEQAVVVEVSLKNTSEQMKVVINKCWATPTQSPADPNSHTFLENRSAAAQSLLYPHVGEHRLYPSLSTNAAFVYLRYKFIFHRCHFIRMPKLDFT
uniref:UROL1 n=1 Tax=Poeciliopsis prolifica TaxID=188132 RepID=A0A0S7ELL0_9TELE